MVLVQQSVHADLPADAVRELERHPVPVVVPFPEASWARTAAPEAHIVELLRRAIGYRVRLG
ncbi:MAG: hypothetical protein ACRELC_11455 [Gemmatimonadota bacterium]